MHNAMQLVLLLAAGLIMQLCCKNIICLLATGPVVTVQVYLLYLSVLEL